MIFIPWGIAVDVHCICRRNLFQHDGGNRGIRLLNLRDRATRWFTEVNAGIAQLVEQLICNQQVVGSNPTAGSFHFRISDFGLRIRQAAAVSPTRRLMPMTRKMRSRFSR